MHGRLLMYNGGDTIERAMFSMHFAPFLIPVAVLHWLIHHPLGGLYILVAVHALGIFPLFLIVKDKFKGYWSVLLTTLLVLYPPFTYALLQGFAEEVFSTSIILYAMYFLLKSRPKPFVITTLILLTLRINMIIPVAALGILAIFRGFRREGIFLFLCSVLWLLFVTILVFPRYPATRFDQPYVLSFFSAYGNTTHEIFTNLLIHPKLVISEMTGVTKIQYIQDTFAPLLYLPLLSPLSLLALPLFLLNISASSTRLASVYTHYPSSITPFLFIGTIYALDSLKRFSGRLKMDPEKTLKGLILILFFWSLHVNINWSMARFNIVNIFYNPIEFQRSNRDSTLDEIVRQLPKDAKVSTSDRFFEHVAERPWFFSPYPPEINPAEIVVLDNWRSSEVYEEFQNSPDWIKIAEPDFISIFVKKNSPQDKYSLDFAEVEYPNSTSIDRRQDIVMGDVDYQQFTLPKSNKPESLLIPVQKMPLYTVGMLKTVRNLFSATYGDLQVSIVNNQNGDPGKNVLYTTIIPGDQISYKTDVLNILLPRELQPGIPYWIVISPKAVTWHKMTNSFALFSPTLKTTTPDVCDKDVKSTYARARLIGQGETLFQYICGRRMTFGIQY